MPSRVMTIIAASLVGWLALAESFTIEPVPAWVRPVPPPAGEAPTSRDVGSGTWWAVVDHQVDVARQHLFYRTVKQVLSPDGVQADSDLRVNFDPAYQRLILHTVSLTRDGAPRNLLQPSIVRLLNREQDADSYLYDGSLDALIILEDVRPGDLVEFAYSVIGSNPIFKGKESEDLQLNWGVPVGRRQVRVVYPADRPLAWRDSEGLPLPAPVPLAPGLLEMTWDDADLPAVDVESQTPDWFTPCRWVSFSEYGSWADVAAWGMEIYGPPAPLTPEMQALVETWRAEAATPAGQALAALRFVQDHIRYLGLEMGEGSHRPTPPELVFNRRFGDCKDKVNLLRALLHGLGIASVPVLVNTDDGPKLVERLPSPLIFNHVVMAISLDERRYLVDPTMSHQGGDLAATSFPDYGKGLVIAPDTIGLTPVAGDPANLGRVHVTHTIHLPDSPADPATMTVRTVYHGDRADEMRWETADGKLERLSRDYVNFYAADYPGIEMDGLPRFTDDPVANQFTSEETYRLQAIWQLDPDGRTHRAQLYTSELESRLWLPNAIRRRSPLRVGYPLHVVQDLVVTFETPANYTFDNNHVRIETDAFAFVHQTLFDGATLRLHYQYEARRDYVPPGEVDEHVRRLKEVFDILGYELFTLPPAVDEPDTKWRVVGLTLALMVITAVASIASTLSILRARGWRRY